MRKTLSLAIGTGAAAAAIMVAGMASAAAGTAHQGATTHQAARTAAASTAGWSGRDAREHARDQADRDRADRDRGGTGADPGTGATGTRVTTAGAPGMAIAIITGTSARPSAATVRSTPARSR